MGLTNTVDPIIINLVDLIYLGFIGVEKMAATFVKTTRSEFETVLGELGGFQAMSLPRVKELVYGKRVDMDGLPLSLRVFTSLDPNGVGRACGKDAIRVEIFVRTSDGTIKRVGGSKRVNRTDGWQGRLEERIAAWQEQLGPRCPKCGLPMVKRKSKTGEFYGCCSYPKCNGTKNV